MFKRQTTGSVVCSSCGSLVGVRDDKCYNCGRRNPGLWGFAPLLRSLGNDLGFVPLVIWGCGALYVISLLLSRQRDRHGRRPLRLSRTETSSCSFCSARAADVPGVRFGRWWTVLSAGWLHGSLLHIIFNMMWVRDLGPVVADMYGAGRMVIIYTVAGVVRISAELGGVRVLPSPSVSERRGSDRRRVRDRSSDSSARCYLRAPHRKLDDPGQRRFDTPSYWVFWSPSCAVWTTSRMRAGSSAGISSPAYLDPLKPERIDHIVIALLCIAAVVLVDRGVGHHRAPAALTAR